MIHFKFVMWYSLERFTSSWIDELLWDCEILLFHWMTNMLHNVVAWYFSLCLMWIHETTCMGCHNYNGKMLTFNQSRGGWWMKWLFVSAVYCVWYSTRDSRQNIQKYAWQSGDYYTCCDLVTQYSIIYLGQHWFRWQIYSVRKSVCLG